MNQTAARPGAALRAFRESMGWTLADVSRRTGLTVSTLSKVENNRVSLNFDKLSRLSSGLGLDLARLLDPSGQPEPNGLPAGRRSVTRKGSETELETHNYRHLYHATDLLNKSFTPLVIELKAGSVEAFGELIRHSGEEFAFVLEGEVEVQSDIYAPLVLKPGDSIFFDSNMGHAFLKCGQAPSRILLVSSDPEHHKNRTARRFRTDGHAAVQRKRN